MSPAAFAGVGPAGTRAGLPAACGPARARARGEGAGAYLDFSSSVKLEMSDATRLSTAIVWSHHGNAAPPPHGDVAVTCRIWVAATQAAARMVFIVMTREERREEGCAEMSGTPRRARGSPWPWGPDHK